MAVKINRKYQVTEMYTLLELYLSRAIKLTALYSFAACLKKSKQNKFLKLCWKLKLAMEIKAAAITQEAK